MKKKIRSKFRIEVFKRDQYKCMICGKQYLEDNAEVYLDVHHIQDRHLFQNGGYVKENGISLCKEKCHLMAEKYHITKGEEYLPGLHPDDLYKKINSSFKLALLKDDKI